MSKLSEFVLFRNIFVAKNIAFWALNRKMWQKKILPEYNECGKFYTIFEETRKMPLNTIFSACARRHTLYSGPEAKISFFFQLN